MQIDPLSWSSWDDLRFLAAAARGGSLNAAARILGVDHTTVGRRIRTLEGRLGCKLFDRCDGRMDLSPAAQEATEELRQLEAMVGLLLGKLRRADERIAGEVRVGITEGLANFWLVPRLQRLQLENPDLRISLVHKRAQHLKVGRDVDIDFSWARPSDPDAVIRKLCDVSYSVYAFPRYAEKYPLPTSLQDLADHRILQFSYYEGDEALRAWNEAVERHGPAMRAESAVVVHATIETSEYVTLLPDYSPLIQPGLVRAAIDLDICSELWLAYDGRRRESQRVRVLTDEIVRLVEADKEVWFT